MLQEVRWAIGGGFNRLIGIVPQEPKPTVITIEGLATGDEREKLVAQYRGMLEKEVLDKSDYRILHDIMMRLLGYVYNPRSVGSEDFPNNAQSPALIDHVVVGDEKVNVSIEFSAREDKGRWTEQIIDFRYKTGDPELSSEGIFDGFEHIGDNSGFHIVPVGTFGRDDASYFSYILGEQRLLLPDAEDGDMRHGNGQWTFFQPYLMKPVFIRSLELYEASRVWENPDALEFPLK